MTDITQDTAELDRCARALADDFLPEGWERTLTHPDRVQSRNTSAGLECTVFFTRSPARALLNRFRGSPARRAVRAAGALEQAGFLVPRILHCGHLDAYTAFLFTELVDGHALHDLVSPTARGAPPQPRLLDRFGQCVGRLHLTGFVHGSLTLNNVIVQTYDDREQFVFINNEALTRYAVPGGRALVQELATLSQSAATHIGPTGQARFFAAWRRQMRHLNNVEARILAAGAYRGR